MQRICDEIEIEIETAHPAADDDDISEEIVEDAEAGEEPGGVGGVPSCRMRYTNKQTNERNGVPWGSMGVLGAPCGVPVRTTDQKESPGDP